MQTPDSALLRAIQDRDLAQQAGDAQRWAVYTTEDFLAIGADGSLKTKAQCVAEISSSKPKDPESPQDEICRNYGSTVIRTWRTNPQEGHAIRFSEVWINQEGQWRAASVHTSVIAKR
jgi:hypothetical protein